MKTFCSLLYCFWNKIVIIMNLTNLSLQLALKYHPDKNPGNEEASDKVTQTHHILKNILIILCKYHFSSYSISLLRLK